MMEWQCMDKTMVAWTVHAVFLVDLFFFDCLIAAMNFGTKRGAESIGAKQRRQGAGIDAHP
jgi:hypothetical protein